MAAIANRQILLVETPKDKLGPQHFRLTDAPMPAPTGRRGASARALHFARRCQPRLDAGRNLPGSGRGRFGHGRWRNRRGHGKQGTGLRGGRPGLRRHGLAGLCRAGWQAAHEGAQGRADDASAERLRHCRAHGLLRASAHRRSETRRDGRGLGRRWLRRYHRRADCQDQGLPRGRHCRRPAEVRLARQGPRLRCRRRLQGRSGLQDAEGSCPEGHRRLFRQRRRRHSGSVPVPDEHRRSRLLLRGDFSLRRSGAPGRPARRARA